LLGIKTPGQLGLSSEMEVLFRVFNETQAMPKKRKLQAQINRLLKAKKGMQNYKFVLRDLTFEKFADVIQYASNLSDRKPLKQNEVREYLNYEPLDEDEPDEVFELFVNMQTGINEILDKLNGNENQ